MRKYGKFLTSGAGHNVKRHKSNESAKQKFKTRHDKKKHKEI